MAAVDSLGVHTPAALSYLLAEGILPSPPPENSYQWETYHGEDDVEEEILNTHHVVVWSQGRFVRNVYRFDLEAEPVTQAVLTHFPASTILRASDQALRTHLSPNRNGTLVKTARALVVLLKTKAHIHFLHGASHIVDIPFEIERAFPAPRGLVLQRKRNSELVVPPTPRFPSAPPNSFFSSEPQPSQQSFLQSPTLRKSFGPTRPSQQTFLGGESTFAAFFRSVIATAEADPEEDVANLYSLSDPFSDLGVISYAIQQHRPRLATKSQGGSDMEFEALNPAEKLIYVSPENELQHCGQGGGAQLLLLATINQSIKTVSVWHGWYVNEVSLQDLQKQSDARNADKAQTARRRSSFVNPAASTGTTTPAVRAREKTRESLVGAGMTRSQGEQHGSQGAALSRTTTRQEEEAVMLSQLDPAYQPTAASQPVRESRRISSVNTDVRTGQNPVSASFAGASRRATSFGGDHGRRSLGHRRSRGSTPAGSVYGQSQYGDDDTMELDSTIEFDPEESLDGVLRHIRATCDAAGFHSIFGDPEQGFKRELVVRKIHSFAVGLRTSTRASVPPYTQDYQVATLADRTPSDVSTESSMKIYLHERQTGEVQCVALRVKRRQLWPDVKTSPTIAIPMLAFESRSGACIDVLKLQDGHASALLFGRQGLQLSPDDPNSCPLPDDAPYRVYDVLDFGLQEDGREIGKNRTITSPELPLQLCHAGRCGAFDEIGTDGVHHRRRLRFEPRQKEISQLLTLLQIMLPKQQARAVHRLWNMSRTLLSQRSYRLAETKSDLEFVALIATMFYFITDVLDSKAKAAIGISDVATGKSSSNLSSSLRLRKNEQEKTVVCRTAWSWMPICRRTSSQLSPRSQEKRRDQLVVIAASVAQELVTTTAYNLPLLGSAAGHVALRLILGLHIYREEQTLNVLHAQQNHAPALASVIAQLGSWLGLDDWTYGRGRYFDQEGANERDWAYIRPSSAPQFTSRAPEPPFSAFSWFENALTRGKLDSYPSLIEVARLGSDLVPSTVYDSATRELTPRLAVLSDILVLTNAFTKSPIQTVSMLADLDTEIELLETLPEALAAPFKEAIARCEREPPTTWEPELLLLIGRSDLAQVPDYSVNTHARPHASPGAGLRDVQGVCAGLEQPRFHTKTREAGRHAISQLIFCEDRRLIEAITLMHFNTVQIAQCPKQPDWDEQAHFEHQRKLVQHVTLRMIALPAGDGMIHYDSQTPLLTEKYHLPGFNSSCIVQPMGHTLTADRSGLTEEKVNWAYFHAGVSAGLRISRNVQGIDTSWIAFNKPSDLTHRHAGLLLSLGLSGHLRHLAKWLSFKYLTPKHTMTSIGLLLGLSASNIGSMDGLITRMLSVHITRMLPPGAAELNVSPATQAAGLVGIGLLYYSTSHRRMSEIMLSEIEYMEVEDPDGGPDPLRDESYRLAAGFALGFINLSKGADLRSLYGMQLAERLLAMAVGPPPVEAVHVFDRATAGAVMALALIYMKCGNQAIAAKIDIPDTEAQFDHVRPDVLMLRAMAKNVILWDNIEARGPTYDQGWIQDNLPVCYKTRCKQVLDSMLQKRTIDSAYIPLFNVFTGLAWALSLKYAGSANETARDEILSLLTFFHRLSEGADAFYFDGKLGRSALRRCMDVLAVAAATVMAGTGDLETFRHLRRMHGRVDADTPYGSHLAAHLAIGALFLAGGTHTFGTSDMAIASLMVAFYPVYPTDVHDNRVHLQAFRHLWVLAAEARCIVVEDVDTQRPIHMPIVVTLKTGEVMGMRTPCLLPEVDNIATVQTDDSAFWQVTLDFANNPDHLLAFRKTQHISVRRCPAAEAHDSAFTAALAAFSDMSLSMPASICKGNQGTNVLWHRLLSLPAFSGFDKADVEFLLPPDMHSSVYTDHRTTAVDDRLLLLMKSLYSSRKEDLWNLRVLFTWAERMRAAEAAKAEEKGIDAMRWLGQEVIEDLKTEVEKRSR